MARQKNLCNQVTPYNRLCKNYCQYHKDKPYSQQRCHIHTPKKSRFVIKMTLILVIAFTVGSAVFHNDHTQLIGDYYNKSLLFFDEAVHIIGKLNIGSADHTDYYYNKSLLFLQAISEWSSVHSIGNLNKLNAM